MCFNLVLTQEIERLAQYLWLLLRSSLTKGIETFDYTLQEQVYRSAISTFDHCIRKILVLIKIWKIHLRNNFMFWGHNIKKKDCKASTIYKCRI